jgi:hypothetical protein
MSVHYTTSVLELDRELAHQGQGVPHQGGTETEVRILATYSLLRLLPGHMLPKSRQIARHRYHISLPRLHALPRKLPHAAVGRVGHRELPGPHDSDVGRRAKLVLLRHLLVAVEAADRDARRNEAPTSMTCSDPGT